VTLYDSRGRAYEFDLPRDNIMSYYHKTTKTLTPDQVERVHEILADRELD